MTQLSKCKWCKGELKKESWTQPFEGGLCPKGTYYYYRCVTCGGRYSVKEVEGENSKDL